MWGLLFMLGFDVFVYTVISWIVLTTVSLLRRKCDG